MKTITKKEFLETITSNESEFLSGGYSRMTTQEALEYLNDFDFSILKGEKRQASPHSKGLKFLKEDGSYSYLSNLYNHKFFKKENILIVIGDENESIAKVYEKAMRFVGIYRILS